MLLRAGLPEQQSIPADWIEAFELLRKLAVMKNRAHTLLFIDELSWMDTPKSDFMMALENFWNGLAFEQVCLLHTDQIKKALGISGIHTDVFSFSCKSNPEAGLYGSQIDMVIRRADQTINIVEMKYSKGPYLISKALDQNMQRKIHDVIASTKTRNAVHLTMVTIHGLEANAYSNNVQFQITAADLFS